VEQSLGGSGGEIPWFLWMWVMKFCSVGAFVFCDFRPSKESSGALRHVPCMRS
jgi:hypothetical protein